MRRRKTEILRQVQKFPAKNFPTELSWQKPNALGKGGGAFDADNGATRQKILGKSMGEHYLIPLAPPAFRDPPSGWLCTRSLSFCCCCWGLFLAFWGANNPPELLHFSSYRVFFFLWCKNLSFNRIRPCVNVDFLKCRHSCDNQRQASVSKCFF